jgi:hypothetical protein
MYSKPENRWSTGSAVSGKLVIVHARDLLRRGVAIHAGRLFDKLAGFSFLKGENVLLDVYIAGGGLF